MKKIEFCRILQGTLSHDVGYIRGVISGKEEFTLVYNLDKLINKRITPKRIYVITCIGSFCIYRGAKSDLAYGYGIHNFLIQEVSFDPERLKRSLVYCLKICPYGTDLQYLVKNIDKVEFV